MGLLSPLVMFPGKDLHHSPLNTVGGAAEDLPEVRGLRGGADGPGGGLHHTDSTARQSSRPSTSRVSASLVVLLLAV